MKSKKQTSVIQRLYAGFALMVALLIATIVLMLDGTSRIHQQLESVTTNALPLVSTTNQTSVSLLAADKVFKDYLTTQDPTRMQTYETNFTQAQEAFVQAREQLANVAKGNPTLNAYLKELSALEERYFNEAHNAMNNYRVQLLAQEERQQSTRRFQQLHTELNVRMKEYIADQDNLSVKMIAMSYFKQLAKTEAITSDALATEDIAKIDKALKDNKKFVNHLGQAYQSLTYQLPELKRIFDKTVAQYTLDIGQKGGVLDQHYEYIEAKNRLYDNIAVLAAEIDQAMVLLDNFRVLANSQMNSAIESANNTYSQGYTNSILIGICVSLLAIFIGWYLAGCVRKPLVSTLKTLEALTDGDMTQRINGNTFIEFDKLSHHINKLADNLQEILSKLSQASEGLTKVAAKNQSTTTEAKHRLNEQRQQTASVATAMTEMEQSVTDVSLSAQQSMERVHAVEKASEIGRDVMSKNIHTAHQLSDRLDESVNAVSKLQEMSNSIGSILDVIRNIADQTNLLALNAAIEAARAGDQGRGFAVVADEVRVLAKRTTDSTSEIENMIQSLQSSSGQAVNVMQTCVSEMTSSITQASDANGAMEEIQALIMEISQMSTQIAQAAEEQQCTTGSIARSLEDISHIADANFSSMEEVADASSKLDELANQQSTLVHRFKL